MPDRENQQTRDPVTGRSGSFTLHKRVKGTGGNAAKSSLSSRSEEELLGRIRNMERDDLFLRSLGGWAATTVYSKAVFCVRGCRRVYLAVAVTRKVLCFITSSETVGSAVASTASTSRPRSPPPSRSAVRRGGQSSALTPATNDNVFSTYETLLPDQRTLGTWTIQCRVPLGNIAGIVFTEADANTVALDYVNLRPIPWHFSVIRFHDAAHCDDFVAFIMREKMKLLGKRASATIPFSILSPSMSTMMSLQSLRSRAQSQPPLSNTLPNALPDFISTVNESLINVEYGKRAISLVKLRRGVDKVNIDLNGKISLETEDDYEQLAANPDVADLIRSKGDTTLKLSVRVEIVPDTSDPKKKKPAVLIVTDSIVIILHDAEREYKVEAIFRIECIDSISHVPAQNFLLFKIFRDGPDYTRTRTSPSPSPRAHSSYDSHLGGGPPHSTTSSRLKECLIHIIGNEYTCSNVNASTPYLNATPQLTAEEVSSKILHHVENVFLDVRIRRLPIKVERDIKARGRLDHAVAKGSRIVAKFIARASREHHETMDLRDVCFSVHMDTTNAFKWLLVIVRIRMFDLIDTFTNLNKHYSIEGEGGHGATSRTRAELHADMMVERRLVLSLLALCAHLDLSQQLLYESVLYELMQCAGGRIGQRTQTDIFQKDTFAVRVILLYLGTRAHQYVKLVISTALDDFLRLKQLKSVHTHASEFMDILHKNNNLNAMPHELKVVIAIIARCVADITKAGIVELDSRKCIGAFLMRRLWGPALQAPDSFGLTVLQLQPAQSTFLRDIFMLLNGVLGFGVQVEDEWLAGHQGKGDAYIDSLIDEALLKEIKVGNQECESEPEDTADEAAPSLPPSPTMLRKESSIGFRPATRTTSVGNATFSSVPSLAQQHNIEMQNSLTLQVPPSPPRSRTPPILSFLQIKRAASGVGEDKALRLSGTTSTTSNSPMISPPPQVLAESTHSAAELLRKQSIMRGGGHAPGHFKSSFHHQSMTRQKVMEVSDADVMALANNLEAVHEALGRDTERLLVSLMQGIQSVDKTMTKLEEEIKRKKDELKSSRSTSPINRRGSSLVSEDSFKEEAPPKEAKKNWNKALTSVSLLVSMHASSSLHRTGSQVDLLSSIKTVAQDEDTQITKARLVVDRYYVLPGVASLLGIAGSVIYALFERAVQRFDPLAIHAVEEEIRRTEALLASQYTAAQHLRQNVAHLRTTLDNLDEMQANDIESPFSSPHSGVGVVGGNATSGTFRSTLSGPTDVLSQTRVLGCQDTASWPVECDGILLNRRWSATSDIVSDTVCASPRIEQQSKSKPQQTPSKYTVTCHSESEEEDGASRGLSYGQRRGLYDAWGEEGEGGEEDVAYGYSSSEIDDDELRNLLLLNRSALDPLSKSRLGVFPSAQSTDIEEEVDDTQNGPTTPDRPPERTTPESKYTVITTFNTTNEDGELLDPAGGYEGEDDAALFGDDEDDEMFLPE